MILHFHENNCVDNIIDDCDTNCNEYEVETLYWNWGETYQLHLDTTLTYRLVSADGSYNSAISSVFSDTTTVGRYTLTITDTTRIRYAIACDCEVTCGGIVSRADFTYDSEFVHAICSNPTFIEGRTWLICIDISDVSCACDMAITATDMSHHDECGGCDWESDCCLNSVEIRKADTCNVRQCYNIANIQYVNACLENPYIFCIDDEVVQLSMPESPPTLGSGCSAENTTFKIVASDGTCSQNIEFDICNTSIISSRNSNMLADVVRLPFQPTSWSWKNENITTRSSSLRIRKLSTTIDRQFQFETNLLSYQTHDDINTLINREEVIFTSNFVNVNQIETKTLIFDDEYEVEGVMKNLGTGTFTMTERDFRKII